MIVFAIVGCAIELIFSRHLCCITRWRGRLLTTGYPPCFRPVVVGGPGRVVWGCGGGAGGGGGPGAARSRPCGAAQRSCAGAGPLPRAWAQLPVDCNCILLLGGGGWCCCGAATHTARSVAACKGAALIDVRLDVGSLQTRSSSPTVAGYRLGGFSVGRDWWGGERVVGGVLPASAFAHGVCVIVYV